MIKMCMKNIKNRSPVKCTPNVATFTINSFHWTV